MQYFFILGHKPTLSVMEIMSQINLPTPCLRRQEAGTNLATNNSNICEISGQFVKIRELSNEFLILETKEEIDCQKLQKRLGGTIKIGKILSLTNADPPAGGLTNADVFLNKLPKSGRVFFGFSVYGFDDRFYVKDLRLKIKKLALKIKKELKEKNISSRWVVSKEKKLSSVVVQKNKLLTQGAEFVLLTTQLNLPAQAGTDQNADQPACAGRRRDISDNQRVNPRESVYIGVTLSCQEFEDYSQRDYGRPSRKIEEGMLPPKLAKIMINLAQTTKDKVLLDPFCGSGTIIQEAAQLGYHHIIGTDINKEAINNTIINLKWFAENFQFSISNFQINHNVQIFQSDVKEISQKISPNLIDAIVTEPYLGPIKILNLKSEMPSIIKELSALYLKSFEEFKKILKKDGRVIIVFPIFSARGGSAVSGQLHFLPILDDLKKSGWQIINPVPPELQKNPVIKITPRNSIIYSRPDQTIFREIFVLKVRS